MKPALTLSFVAAALLHTSAARASGLTDHGEDLRAPESVLRFDGYFRMRGALRCRGLRFDGTRAAPSGPRGERALEVTIEMPQRQKRARSRSSPVANRLASEMASNKAPRTVPDTETLTIETSMPVNRWWSIALRGVAALALGILSLFWPGSPS